MPVSNPSPNDHLQHKTSEKGQDDHTMDFSKTIPVVIKKKLNQLQDVDTHQSLMKKL